MARKAKAATIWLEVMLWTFEAARSFGLWALVAQITNANRKQAGDGNTVPVDKERLAELEEREANAKRGGKKAARTRRVGTKIEMTRKAAEDKIAAYMAAKQQGKSTAEVAEDFKTTVAQMKASYGPYMTQEEYDYLFPSALVPVDPKPAPEAEPEATDSSQSQDADDSEDEDEAPPVAAE
jgi:nucleosome binding factor SPN SPT16 subunit